MRQIKKTVCIIGANGFVGKSIISSFKKKLLKKYNIGKIIGICRRPGQLKILKLSNSKNVNIYKLNIKITKYLPKADYYIYSTETSIINKYKNKQIVNEYKQCMENFSNLLKKNYKDKKILYVSSGSINKKKNKKYYNYNLVKKYSEKKIKNLSNFNFKTSIARCYTFIGEHLPLNKHFVIGNMILDAIKNNQILLKSNYKVFRSYMFADDMVDWLIKILLTSTNKTRTFNVGSDEVVEIGKVANIIGNLFNKSVIRPKITNKNTDIYTPNINKTKKEMRLKLNYDLIQSIKVTINRILKNEKKN